MPRQTALMEYRANPNDINFNRVAAIYEPWLRRTGLEALGRFSNLAPCADLDDLRVEGLLSLSRSARRFLFFCPVCGATFLSGRGLRAHAMEEHRVRGEVGMVSIETFCEVSARLAMRRAARRLIRPEEILLDEPPEMADESAEERIILADLLRRAEARLSGEAMALLVRLLNGENLPTRAVRGGRALRVPTARRRMKDLMQSNDELKEVLMENAVTTSIPEKGPRWKVLSLQTLKESAKEVLDVEVTERTVRGAYDEVLGQLAERELEYVCGRCNAPIDAEMKRCWACGAAISDAGEEEEPEMKLAEIQARAKALGIPITAGNTRKSKEVLTKEVEAAEARRRSAARGADVHGIEAQKLNEVLTEKMPDGWTKSVSKQFTSYWDSDHVRRISVMLRGFRVCFCVDDGFFGEEKDFPEGLDFFPPEERRRRHYGRDNYIYRGDVSKVAVKMAEAVFKRYGKKPTAKPKK